MGLEHLKRNYKNSYERHEQVVVQSLYSFYSTKEIFGRQVKRRLFNKWHHRYMRERNRNIKRCGKQNQKDNIEYFGRIVYTYYFQQDGENSVAYTCKPRCRQSQPFPLNYAREDMRRFYEAQNCLQ